MKLRIVLGQLVALTLASGCSKQHTGGGCSSERATKTLGTDADDAMKSLLAACVDRETCVPVCRELAGTGVYVNDCKVVKDGDTAVATYEWGHTCAGRRPCPMPTVRIRTVAQWLVEQGRLEAASVVAFEQLARDLEAHGAPARLARAARRAAGDETRHARACRATPPRGPRLRSIDAPIDAPIDSPSRRTPSIEALAVDNAIEGEVRETWGAITASWQAHTAGSPAIRALMCAIAPDELRHAELSRSLARWYASRLSPAARRRVAAARAAAIDELARAVIAPMPGELVETAGLPSPAAAAELLAGLRATAWA